MADTDGARVVVMGAGPAGCVTARALAQLGHEVILLYGAPRPHTPEVESLPPSAAALVVQLGLTDVVLGASVARMPGNTVLWAGVPVVDTAFAEAGHQVARTELDPLLRFAAQAAGVDVRARVKAVAIEESAESVVVTTRDREGRAEALTASAVVLAQGRGTVGGSAARRVRPRGWRTLAVCGAWTGVPALPPPRDASTWIESGDAGWGWMVPMGRGAMQVTVMIDPPTRATTGARGGVERLYRDALAGLPGIARVVSAGQLAWARATEASASLVSPAWTPRTLRVGDACATVDPIASFGIKKALGSARLAAAVVNTVLRRPALAEAALSQYGQAESREFAGSMAGAAAEAARAAAFHGTPFWAKRTFKSARLRAPLPAPAATSAIPDGRAVTLADGARIEPRVVLEGWLFAERPALVSPHWPEGLRYLGGVDVPFLIDAAKSSGAPPDIAGHYRRLAGRDASPEAIASALGHLLSAGAIVHR